MRRQASGFTLLEMVIAMVLLAAMLSMAWGGLQYALRAWDVGGAKGHRSADMQLSQNFIRREISELFPLRFKDAMQLRFAFEGKPNRLRFASSRPAGIAAAGLSLVSFEVQTDGRTRNLVMRRAVPDDDITDFSALDRADPVVLFQDIDAVEFAYFGAEADLIEPKWVDDWPFPTRMPQLVRMRVREADGHVLEDFVGRIMLAEEAGCLENTFQRGCRPRRPAAPS